MVTKQENGGSMQKKNVSPDRHSGAMPEKNNLASKERYGTDKAPSEKRKKMHDRSDLLEHLRERERKETAAKIDETFKQHEVPIKLREATVPKIPDYLKHLGGDFTLTAMNLIAGNPHGMLRPWPYHAKILDQQLGGLWPGLTLWVGAPGVTKSWLMLIIALLQAIHGNMKVVLCELENGYLRCWQRISALTGIATCKELRAEPGIIKKEPERFERMLKLLDTLSGRFRYMTKTDLRPLSKTDEIETFVQIVFGMKWSELRRSEEKWVCLVDSINKLPSPYENPTIRIGSISNLLEEIAQCNNINVLATSELRKRDGKKAPPTLEDIRDNLSLPYACSNVYALLADDDSDNEKGAKRITIHTLKGRDGQQENAPFTLTFNPELERFEEIPPALESTGDSRLPKKRSSQKRMDDSIHTVTLMLNTAPPLNPTGTATTASEEDEEDPTNEDEDGEDYDFDDERDAIAPPKVKPAEEVDDEEDYEDE